MLKSPLNYRTAFVLALGISLLMNIIFFIMFLYGRGAVLLAEVDHGIPEFPISSILTRGIFFNFIVPFLLYLLNFRLLKIRAFPRFKWLFVVLPMFICTGAISSVCSLIQIYIQFQDIGPYPGLIIRGGMFRDYFIALFVILSSQLIYLTNKQQQTALENEMLQAENMKTRFMALKNQVDPHFLFNSLNTLHSLIKTDADKAQEYVQQLSSVFRYTLQNKEIITLEEELKFTMAYCHLMKIRYGDSLQFVQHIDEAYSAYSIISLSLQTLVENAIKHNVVSNKQPLSIVFSTSTYGTISISNPIQPKKDVESGENIGLSNLAERYRLIWNKEIVIRNTEGIFMVEIPLIQ
ncbi:Sensor histidine kinase YpdA [termite gut metagenome]|uniref:Sensor histidine kinase YpdA n=1 Tax=termite gut metagenome TaxID=433724 RepID=A0A5J4RED5_9ZZZZ